MTNRVMCHECETLLKLNISTQGAASLLGWCFDIDLSVDAHDLKNRNAHVGKR